MTEQSAWLAEEWLARLNELSRPASHELRNTLNGVAVNLEVIRSRSHRPGQLAEGLAPFAEAAAEQAELLSELMEVVLSLIRPRSEPVELGRLLERMGALLGAASRGRGGSVTVELVQGDAPQELVVRDPNVRLLVLATLLDAFEAGAGLTCRLAATTTLTLHVRRPGSVLPAPPERLATLATLAGAGLSVEPGGWALSLPASVSRG